MVEIFKIGVVELLSIIRNDDTWNSEPTNDVFLDNTLDFCFCNLGKGFCHDPFGKVIDFNK